MPKFNSRGDVAHGVGGGQASINNVPFSPGGVLGWLDDDTVAFANGADNWFVSTYNRTSQVIARLDDGTGQRFQLKPPVRQFSRSFTRSPLQVATGANVGYAGGGVAAWSLQSNDDLRGLHSNIGFRAVDGGLLNVGPDGSIAYKPQYQSNGPTLIHERLGDEWQLTDGHADYISWVGPKRLLYMQRMQVFAAGISDSLAYSVDGGIWKVQGIAVNGKLYLCYFSGAHGIVLHPSNSFVGIPHLAPGVDGWHEAIALEPGIVRIATSSGEGEQPGQIWVRDYDVKNNAQRDPWGDGQWKPITVVDIRTLGAPPIVIDPPKEPTKMEMPRDVYDILAAVARKFKSMHLGDDDQRRIATERGVQTLQARGFTRWVCKAGGPGNPKSKDAVASIPDGLPIENRRQSKMFMFDTINGSTRDFNGFPMTGEEGEQWIVVEAGPKDWLADEDGPVQPPPVGDTHLYIGGGNDTNTCDQCGKSRYDAVHAIPQSKVKHTYDGGEQDTGLCDICQKSREDQIHQPVQPPVDPPVDPDPEVPVDKHEFVPMKRNPNLCAECGLPKTDKVHDMTVPGGGTFDDSRIVAALGDILEEQKRTTAAVAKVATQVKASSDALVKAIGTIGGLGGLLKGK